MKIGILGCGYVGQAAAKQWSRVGYETSATTRKAERILSLQAINTRVHLLENSSSLFSFLSEQEALLISLAADSSNDYHSTYLQTAKQMAQFLPQLPQLRYILYTSSTSIYGDFQGAWVDESTHARPSTPNSCCLYETEHTLLALATEQRKVCVFRLGEIYGPGRLIGDRLLHTPQRVFPGSGESYTNIIHLKDIVRALDFALSHQLNGVFNLCNDFHIPRKLFYAALCQEANLPHIQWDPKRPSAHSGNKRVSNQKIKALGFSFCEPTYSFSHSPSNKDGNS